MTARVLPSFDSAVVCIRNLAFRVSLNWKRRVWDFGEPTTEGINARLLCCHQVDESPKDKMPKVIDIDAEELEAGAIGWGK